MVGSTLAICNKCFELLAGAQLNVFFVGSATRFNFFKLGLSHDKLKKCVFLILKMCIFLNYFAVDVVKDTRNGQKLN